MKRRVPRRRAEAGIAKFALFFACAFGVGGCATQHYASTVTGNLEGNLMVEWHKPNSFVFVPSQDQPLTFTRGGNGDQIQPDRMWTDGGSVPRAFWVFKNFSPWGYGPAFIVHDWLFHMQDCQLPGHEQYDLETAATIMSEVMKTLLEDPEFDYGSKASMYMMYEAVRGEVARQVWEEHDCQPIEALAPRGVPDAVFELSF